MLGRTVAILSGMCTGLNPHFNVWEGLAPFAQKLIAEEPLEGWEFWRDELVDQGRALWRLPRQVQSVLDKMEREQLVVNLPGVAKEMRRLELAVRRMVGGVVFAALLVGSVQLYLASQVALGGFLIGGALLALIWALLI